MRIPLPVLLVIGVFLENEDILQETGDILRLIL